MRKLIVSEFITLDGVIQAPGGEDEDRDNGFARGAWTLPYWHDDIGATFGALMQDVDAFLLGRKTYVTHAQAFEPMPAGDLFGDMMNAPAKYVVSKTLEKPIWRNTTIIRENSSRPSARSRRSPVRPSSRTGAHSSSTPCSRTTWSTSCTCSFTRSRSEVESASFPKMCKRNSR